MIVTEDPLFYYITYAPGAMHVQRKQPIRATDDQLSYHEGVIILLCRAMLDAAPEGEKK